MSVDRKQSKQEENELERSNVLDESHDDSLEVTGGKKDRNVIREKLCSAKEIHSQRQNVPMKDIMFKMKPNYSSVMPMKAVKEELKEKRKRLIKLKSVEVIKDNHQGSLQRLSAHNTASKDGTEASHLQEDTQCDVNNQSVQNTKSNLISIMTQNLVVSNSNTALQSQQQSGRKSNIRRSRTTAVKFEVLAEDQCEFCDNRHEIEFSTKCSQKYRFICDAELSHKISCSNEVLFSGCGQKVCADHSNVIKVWRKSFDPKSKKEKKQLKRLDFLSCKNCEFQYNLTNKKINQRCQLITFLLQSVFIIAVVLIIVFRNKDES